LESKKQTNKGSEGELTKQINLYTPPVCFLCWRP